MEPQQPTFTPPQAPVVPTPPTPPSSSVKSSLLVIMAVLLLIAVGLAGLFYFQIQKLSKELASLQTQPTPTPLSTETSAQAETANWKTYTNNVANFLIKYPESWSAENVAAGNKASSALPNSMMIDISKTDKTETYPEGIMSIQIFQGKPSYPSTFVKSTGTINDQTYEKYSTTTDQQLASETYLFTSVDGKSFVEILIRYKAGNSYKELFDQILSTFKFLDQNSQNQNCEIDRIYESTAVNPATCQCPSGSEKNVVETSWGPCPIAGMKDCPQTKFKCVEEK